MKFLQKLGKALMLPVAGCQSVVSLWVLDIGYVRQLCRAEISRVQRI